MIDDMRENSSCLRRDELCTSNGLVMKLKGKMGNSETSTEKINDLPKAEKVKVAVVSFGQDEETQLVNDRDLALKPAVVELSNQGLGGTANQSSKKIGGTEKGNTSSQELQMKQITIPIKVKEKRELVLFIMNEEEGED
ncbi:uncharacterized protein E6C27_scaffold400G00420 [Cucumis melo var. makuwa]|nr:uncharacterized protein E6C27_scaffold400G00420 [Cucumis melo var. makuwa]